MSSIFVSLGIFLKALPELVGLMRDLIAAINSIHSSFQKSQEEKWINLGREIAREVANAKTDHERAELVKKLSNYWNSRP